MADTRRGFLQTAGLAAGLAGTASSAAAQMPVPGRGQGPGRGSAQPSTPPRPASEVQVPKMKFGGAEISRLIAGCNPFYGWSHFNNTLNSAMTEYYTAERICAVLHQCNRFGINALNFLSGSGGRGTQDFQQFQAEGGRMHLIVQGSGDMATLIQTLKPLAIYHLGDITDRAFNTGQMDTVREWCKKVRDTGTLVGVGTHKPEVIQMVEEEGWDVDFYAGCVYNRTRTQDEFRELLGGELPLGEIYLADDPPRMYKVIKQTKKTCFAFKILAAGRVTNVDEAFRLAFTSIKPTDGVFIGLFPKYRDEVRENAERTHRILAT